MSEIGIISIGAAVPQRILTNADLEKMVETTDEWIVTRTGIRERHIMSPDETVAGLVTRAAKNACGRIGRNPQELDFVISSTLTPDRISPAQSFEVARGLEMGHAFCFDMNAACSGFIYALAMAKSLLKTRNISSGLVTAGEQLSTLTDYRDRSSCILFGDAAVAALVTNDHPDHIIRYSELGSDPSLADEVVIGGVRDLMNDRRDDFYFRQNGKVVFKFAVSKIKEICERVPRLAGLTIDDIEYIIPHQANMRIVEAASKEIASDKTQFLYNIAKFGNTSSASIGLVLNDEWSRFQKGDHILLIGFGGGLSWGAALIEW